MNGYIEGLSTPDPNSRQSNLARFNIRAVKNERRSAEAGRPIFEDVEYVEIMIPGDRTSTVHRPARDEDKEIYRRAYEAFQKGKDGTEAGTPLTEWTQISRSQAEELAYFNIRTVEALGAVSDGNLQNIGPYHKLRAAARDFLARADAEAPISKLQAQLTKNEATIASLQNIADEQGKIIEQLKTKLGIKDPPNRKG